MTELEEKKEVQSLSEQNSKMVEELTALRNQIRESKILKYKELCAEKKVKEMDMSKASSETIDFAISQIQVIEVAIPQLKTEMKSIVSEKKEIPKSNFVIEQAENGKGFALWEMPDTAKLRKLHNDSLGTLKTW